MSHGALLYNGGDGLAPYTIGAAFPDASSKVTELLLSMRSSKGTDGDRYLSDLVNDTSWADCAATARGWTVTLENDTSSLDDTANGSVGNAARLLGTSTNIGVMLRRVRITRTTKLDSLRGREYALLRLRSSAAAEWEVQLRWSQSIAEPATVVNTAVTHDTTAASAFGYVEVPVGYIDIPVQQTPSLTAVALEVWARRISGTGNLHMDLVRLLPAGTGDVLTKITIPPGGEEQWLGSELTTPPFKRAADPTWTAGSIDPPSALALVVANRAGGVSPNTGLAWAVGRHRVAFFFRASGGGVTVKYRATNVTDDAEVAAVTETLAAPATTYFERTIEFDAAAGKNYQPMLAMTATTGGAVYLERVTHEFIPSTGQNETLRADPDRGTVEKLGSDGGLFLPADIKGSIPFWLPPGLAAVFAIPLDVAKAGYTEPESVKARTLTLSATGAARYYQ